MKKFMHNKHTYIIITFLIIVSFIAFGRIVNNAFINLDDNIYIAENNIKSGINYENIKWAFTNTYNYWHPLTWLSHTLDWSLFGSNAGGHHAISLFLHISTVVFLFLFLTKTTNDIWSAAFVAAFFSLHPLRVESVAWAAERKDVLSMLFGVVCIYAYAFYAQNSKISNYFLSLVFFVFALMAKPTMVTLPFVLMLLDYWPLNRWQKNEYESAKSRSYSVRMLMGEKIPFILFTMVFSIVTVLTQNKVEALASVRDLPFSDRITNAIISYAVYLGKILLPFNLSVFYPYESSIPVWTILISGLIITGITVFILYHMKKLPFLFVGWFWYIGTLIPLIGLIQSGTQAMADRHTYLPFIGIGIMLAWGIPHLIDKENIRKKILFPAAITVLVLLTALTSVQCGYWKDSINLFSHALRVTQNNYLAHNSRGIAYGESHQYQKAIDDFNKAIYLKPDYFKAYNNRGFTYTKLGQYQNALHDYNEAIRLKPDYAKAYNNRGHIHLIQGNTISGCRDAQKACALGACETFAEAKFKGLCN